LSLRSLQIWNPDEGRLLKRLEGNYSSSGFISYAAPADSKICSAVSNSEADERLNGDHSGADEHGAILAKAQ
jgi:hypothetical protein